MRKGRAKGKRQKAKDGGQMTDKERDVPPILLNYTFSLSLEP
jgi:hypothetical protein